MRDGAPAPEKTAIRDAATIVLVRDAAGPDPKVLMGQRGAGAAFMPNKFVFPGGALDPEDAQVELAAPVEPGMRRKLAALPVTDTVPAPEAMVAGAIRELWEEAGLMLGRPGAWAGPLPGDWRAFAEAGMRPSPEGMRYIFRAITPPGRPRRFDARFFLADAATIDADLDDFGRACDELSHLHWIEIAEARRLDLPFITEVVLAEAEEVLRRGLPESVPFFDNSGQNSTFRRID
jgi:8-oxo-dGTP pyrophosphatase MutT (NUDIX family)